MQNYLPLIIASLLYLIRIREFLIRRETIKGQIKEKASFLFLFLGGTLVTLSSMAEYIALDRSPSFLSVILGTLITLGAFSYRNWAIRTLGKFWSVHVEIRDNHSLITSGPFKNVRHPVYTAALLEAVGIVIILQAYISFIIIPLIIFPAIIYRIRIEENELIQKFKNEYEEYIKRSWPLLPKFF